MTTIPPPSTSLAGRYRFSRLLPAGPRAVVWLAVDGETDKLVVAAALGRGRLGSLAAAVGVHHDHLARMLDLVHDPRPEEIPGGGRVQAAAVGIAEYIPGGTLHDQLRTRRLGVWDAVTWFARLADAIAALHEVGCAHGAISPRSIVVAPEGRGVRPVISQLEHPPSGAFCSPERVGGGAPSPEDDLWALHASLYAAVTGGAPFNGKTKEDLAQAMRSGRYTRLSALGVGDTALDAILDRGLCAERHERIASAVAAREALAQWSRQASESQWSDDQPRITGLADVGEPEPPSFNEEDVALNSSVMPGPGFAAFEDTTPAAAVPRLGDLPAIVPAAGQSVNPGGSATAPPAPASPAAAAATASAPPPAPAPPALRPPSDRAPTGRPASVRPPTSPSSGAAALTATASPDARPAFPWGKAGAAAAMAAVAVGSFLTLRGPAEPEPPVHVPVATLKPLALSAQAAQGPAPLASPPASDVALTAPPAATSAAPAAGGALAGSAAAAASVAPAPEAAPAPTPTPTPVAPAPAAAAQPGTAAGGDPRACVASAFPAGTFKGTEDFAFVCAEPDLRTVASRMSSRLVVAGGGGVSAAMKEWSQLGWFQLGAAAAVRARCCPSPSFELPPSGAGCTGIAEAVTAAVAAPLTAADVPTRAKGLEAAIQCHFRLELPRNYAYRDRPSGANRVIFEGFLRRLAGP